MGPTMAFTRAWLLCGLLLVGPVLRVLAAFGDDISQDNEDNRFAVMGQVTKDAFDVQDGVVTLQLNVQDTVGVMDIWILDFQEYRFNLDGFPVDEFTGILRMDRTSECSSVYENADWNTYFNDTYFQDKSSGDLNAKNLFTTFQRGEMDDDGIMRNDKIIFSGDMATFFACKDSSNENFIWELTDITDDEIEYRTKLYATNVRPKDPLDATGGVSFVQSHIELIWRLSRVALAKFLISSTALIRPILEFARVSAVYDAQNRAIPTQTALHIRFRTVVDSNDQMVSYQHGTITYKPDNINHSLNRIVYQPEGTLETAPSCVFKLDEGTGTQMQCQQTWEYKVVLNVDISGQVDNRVPIDASGAFEFLFDTYRCTLSNNALDIATCELVSAEPAKISALITIQTTVFVQDEEDDQVIIILHSLTGASNEDLSYSTASRGVAHREYVELKVKFSPALLRQDYDLDLLLFMICKGEEYAGDQYLQGCLEAPAEDRYVGHRDPAFTYTPRITNENGTTLLDPYNHSHVASDVLQPLDIHGYLRQDESGTPLSIPVHRSSFYNLALSGESAVYTITAVYRLVEAPGRKRRAPFHMQDVVLAKGVTGSRGASKTTGTIIERHARDVEDSTRDTHASKIPFLSTGCPEGAEHIPEELDCKCPLGTEYDLNSFNCEAPPQVEDEEDKDEASDVEEEGNAQHVVCSVWLMVATNSLIFLLFKTQLLE